MSDGRKRPKQAARRQRSTATQAQPFSNATTRVRKAEPGTLWPGRSLLELGQILTSPETRLEYRIERVLGSGGFGEAFLARRLNRSSAVPEKLCIKVSRHSESWVREVYFGQVLAGHPRAIQLYDAFAVSGHDGHVLYAMALELARHGDLRRYLQADPRPWPERIARREIAGVLEVLGKLHRGQVLHRDLTPMNVFVCDSRKLKLGDFGIVRQQTDRRGTKADALNPTMAPSEIVAATAPKWQARDDVYQVGQLLAMLVIGSADRRVRTQDLRLLSCSDQLKEIMHRCIGERRKRYETAVELIEALEQRPPVLRSGRVYSLRGVHLFFTGILSRPRVEAARAARKAGAIVHRGPSAKTSVVVRGRPNPLQAAGRDAGLKLMELKRLREKGYKIALLNEAQFWRLVERR